ncbi:8-oxo-dGTP diphosphatase [Candidatus Woesearchaeota archaeon]|nr:8-oxo-dGTP diphosphatase [Candidatus Woesearchaeota archaeon]
MKLATLCYVRKDQKTLMIHRNKKEGDMHAGKWNALGGKLEPGESPEECAIREIKEESGLTVGKLTFKGQITFPKFSKEQDWYVFVYVAEQCSGELIDCPEGDLAWIDNDKLLDLNLWEGDLVFIPWLDKEKIFMAKFTYLNGKLKAHEVSFY